MKYVENGLEVDLVKLPDGTYLEFEWRDVVGYEGYYLVSNYGHVKTVPRRFVNSRGQAVQVKERILTYSVLGGYNRISTESKHSGRLCKFAHRLVAEAFLPDFNPELEVDHIDRDKKNNVVTNLRMATPTQNNANKPPQKGVSKYKGVHQNSRTGRWQATIRFNKEFINLGSYIIEENAARAYNLKAKELFGEHAYLNDVSPDMEVEVKPKQSNKPRPVKCMTDGRLFPSLNEASRATKTSVHQIEKSCRLETKTLSGLRFTFVEGIKTQDQE